MVLAVIEKPVFSLSHNSYFFFASSTRIHVVDNLKIHFIGNLASQRSVQIRNQSPHHKSFLNLNWPCKMTWMYEENYALDNKMHIQFDRRNNSTMALKWVRWQSFSSMCWAWRSMPITRLLEWAAQFGLVSVEEQNERVNVRFNWERFFISFVDIRNFGWHNNVF